MKNRMEWNLIHIANMYRGITTVAIQENCTEARMTEILKLTGIATLVVSRDQIEQICKMKGSLKTLICVD